MGLRQAPVQLSQQVALVTRLFVYSGGCWSHPRGARPRTIRRWRFWREDPLITRLIPNSTIVTIFAQRVWAFNYGIYECSTRQRKKVWRNEWSMNHFLCIVSSRKDRMNTSSPYNHLQAKIVPPPKVTFEDCERNTSVDVWEGDKFWSGILFAIPKQGPLTQCFSWIFSKHLETLKIFQLKWLP